MTEPTRRSEFTAGARAMIPLIVGALPFGVIFGALAGASGLSFGATMSMSALVFAGSSQFIAAQLIGAGAPLLFIVVTTFIVNLRHALYGATLAPYTKHLPQIWLLPLGFMLTDEAFVIAVQRYERLDASPYKHWYFLGAALSLYINWQLCTLVGVIAGQSIPDPAGWGLDFALVATFIGMLVSLVRGRAVVAAVVVAGGIALMAYPLPNQVYLMLAAGGGIVAGMIGEMIWGKPVETPKVRAYEGAADESDRS